MKRKHCSCSNSVDKHDHNVPTGNLSSSSSSSGVKLSDDQLKRLESLWKTDDRPSFD